MKGKGLVKGLGVTFKKFFEKKVTEKYPEVKPQLPPRSHGSFDYQADMCISCNLCAMACPNSVIRVESSKDEKGKKVLESYKMNLSYCLFCGLCVEACPTKALKFKTDFELACDKRVGTVYTWNGKAKNKETDSTANDTVAADKE